MSGKRGWTSRLMSWLRTRWGVATLAAVVVAVAAGVVVPLVLGHHERNAQAFPVSADATATLEALSHNPVQARMYLDPGSEPETGTDYDLIDALMLQLPGSATDTVLHAAAPPLEPFPSDKALGDALLAAGNDPTDPAAHRIANAAIFDAWFGCTPRRRPGLRHPLALLIADYLRVGDTGIGSSNRGEIAGAFPLKLQELVQDPNLGPGDYDMIADAALSWITARLRTLSPAAPFLFAVNGVLAPDPEAAKLGPTEELDDSAQQAADILYGIYRGRYLNHRETEGEAAASAEYHTSVSNIKADMASALAENPVSVSLGTKFLDVYSTHFADDEGGHPLVRQCWSA